MTRTKKTRCNLVTIRPVGGPKIDLRRCEVFVLGDNGERAPLRLTSKGPDNAVHPGPMTGLHNILVLSDHGSFTMTLDMDRPHHPAVSTTDFIGVRRTQGAVALRALALTALDSEHLSATEVAELLTAAAIAGDRKGPGGEWCDTPELAALARHFPDTFTATLLADVNRLDKRPAAYRDALVTATAALGIPTGHSDLIASALLFHPDLWWSAPTLAATSPRLCALMAAHPNPSVRSYTAHNEHCPPATLAELTVYPDHQVRLAALESPHTPTSALTDPTRVEPRDVDVGMYEEKLHAVAANPNTSPDVITTLLDEHFDECAHGAAWNPTTSAADLYRIASDVPDTHVLFGVARNPNATVSTLDVVLRRMADADAYDAADTIEAATAARETRLAAEGVTGNVT